MSPLLPWSKIHPPGDYYSTLCYIQYPRSLFCIITSNRNHPGCTLPRWRFVVAATAEQQGYAINIILWNHNSYFRCCWWRWVAAATEHYMDNIKWMSLLNNAPGEWGMFVNNGALENGNKSPWMLAIPAYWSLSFNFATLNRTQLVAKKTMCGTTSFYHLTPTHIVYLSLLSSLTSPRDIFGQIIGAGFCPSNSSCPSTERTSRPHVPLYVGDF